MSWWRRPLTEEDLIQSLKDELANEFGEIYFGTDDELELRKLPLGVPVLDRLLSGGLAFNRCTVVFGERSAGKTALAYIAMKQAQEMGIPVVYIDVERSWDPERAIQLGLDPEKIIVAEPRTGEAAFDIAVAVVKSEPAGVVVIDSLAAMTAKAEIESTGMEQQFVGLQARLINRGMRTIITENQGWCVIAINQMRSTVGVSYGSPEVLPGGKGQEFYAWQIIRVRRGAWIEEGSGPGRTNRVGYRLKLQLEKNKQGVPFQETEVPFYFEHGVDEIAGAVDMALELKVFGPGRAGFYKWNDQTIRGERNLVDHFRDDPDEFARLMVAVEETEEGF